MSQTPGAPGYEEILTWLRQLLVDEGMVDDEQITNLEDMLLLEFESVERHLLYYEIQQRWQIDTTPLRRQFEGGAVEPDEEFPIDQNHGSPEFTVKDLVLALTTLVSQQSSHY